MRSAESRLQSRTGEETGRDAWRHKLVEVTGGDNTCEPLKPRYWFRSAASHSKLLGPLVLLSLHHAA